MRKILVLALAVMMVLAMVPTVAMAAETKEEGSEVTANSDVSFTIYIPPTVDLEKLTKGETKSKEFPVSASNVFLEDGGYIDLTARGSGPNGEFVLYDLEGLGSNSLAYALNGPKGNVSPGGSYAQITVDGPQTGSVGVTNASIPFAGIYKGIMTFTISYVGPEIQDVPPSGSADVAHLKGFADLGTVDFGFKNWKIGDFSSLAVSIYKDNKKLATVTLRDEKFDELADLSNITCSLVEEDYWDNDQDVSTYGHYAGMFDSMSLKVVKDGKTYIFRSTHMTISGKD